MAHVNVAKPDGLVDSCSVMGRMSGLMGHSLKINNVNGCLLRLSAQLALSKDTLCVHRLNVISGATNMKVEQM